MHFNKNRHSQISSFEFCNSYFCNDYVYYFQHNCKGNKLNNS